MKRIVVLWLLAMLLPVAAGAMAGPKDGFTTINLRACVDAGDGACETAGDVFVDGVGICFQKAGGETHCGVTEDGEHWFDSQPAGSYWAYATFLPEGYTVAGITATIWPDIPYHPSSYQKGKERIHFVVKRDVDAVNVNILLIPVD
jgi:hypothetical protein